MTTSRSLDGLRRSTDKRKAATRSKIKKALRDMQRKGLTINVNAVAKYAGVARKTIYNHQSLLDDIRAAGTAPSQIHPAPSRLASIFNRELCLRPSSANSAFAPGSARALRVMRSSGGSLSRNSQAMVSKGGWPGLPKRIECAPNLQSSDP